MVRENYLIREKKKEDAIEHARKLAQTAVVRARYEEKQAKKRARWKALPEAEKEEKRARSEKIEQRREKKNENACELCCAAWGKTSYLLTAHSRRMHWRNVCPLLSSILPPRR